MRLSMRNLITPALWPAGLLAFAAAAHAAARAAQHLPGELPPYRHRRQHGHRRMPPPQRRLQADLAAHRRRREPRWDAALQNRLRGEQLPEQLQGHPDRRRRDLRAVPERRRELRQELDRDPRHGERGRRFALRPRPAGEVRREHSFSREAGEGICVAPKLLIEFAPGGPRRAVLATPELRRETSIETGRRGAGGAHRVDFRGRSEIALRLCLAQSDRRQRFPQARQGRHGPGRQGAGGRMQDL